jgi:hypothetical protein
VLPGKASGRNHTDGSLAQITNVRVLLVLCKKLSEQLGVKIIFG